METTKGRFLIKRSATPASLAQLAEGSLLMFLRNIPRLASSLVRSWAQRSLPWLVRESLLHRLSVDWGGVEDRRRTVQKVWSLLYSCSITTIDLPAWLGKFPVWPPVRVNFTHFTYSDEPTRQSIVSYMGCYYPKTSTSPLAGNFYLKSL